MSYYASGGGTLEFRSEINPDDIILSDDTCFKFNIYKGSLEVEFPYDKYWEDDVRECLDKIKHLISSGKIEFIGEDGCHWCFRFKDGEYAEENGVIIYEKENNANNRQKEVLKKLLSNLSNGMSVVDNAIAYGLTHDDIIELHLTDSATSVVSATDKEGD